MFRLNSKTTNQPSMTSQTKKKQQHPPWQDLNPLILTKVFSFLSINDQLFGPPFVCHSWLSATLETIFKNSVLDLQLLDTLDEENQRLRFTHLLKLAIDQYPDWSSIYFPKKNMLGYFGTMYISEKTPRISCVVSSSQADFSIFVSLLYWKNLRIFRAPIGPEAGMAWMEQLSDYCKKISELRIQGTLMDKEVRCIVKGLPLLQVLDLSESTLSSNALKILLDGDKLKFLREVNVLHCKFADENGNKFDIREDYVKLKEFNKEVVEKASKVKSLKKFMHCLVITCAVCKENQSSDKENT